MKLLKILGLFIIFGTVVTFGSEVGVQFSIPGAQKLIPTVEARVGRPLTPVSAAGVARRSVRRCAAGVYNCKLSTPQVLDSKIAQTSSGYNQVKQVKNLPCTCNFASNV